MQEDNETQGYISRGGGVALCRAVRNGRHPWCTIVSHQTADVTKMQGRSQGFRQRIGRVDDTRDVTQDDVAIDLPFLNGEVLDVNVA